MAENKFIELPDIASVNQFLAQSKDAPGILFKHSNTCGISARAYREMAQLDQTVGMITVQKAREVSDEIERRYGLSHETPQVLIVRDGKVLWSASHGRVKAQAVKAALESVSSEQ